MEEQNWPGWLIITLNSLLCCYGTLSAWTIGLSLGMLRPVYNSTFLCKCDETTMSAITAALKYYHLIIVASLVIHEQSPQAAACHEVYDRVQS